MNRFVIFRKILRAEAHAAALTRTTLVLFAICIAALAPAQDQAPVAHAGALGGTLTRSANQYKGLELRLLEALQENDKSSVSSLLTADFEVWNPGAGSPVSRTEWDRRWKKTHRGDYQLWNFSTREFGDVAVVSFVLHPSSAALPSIFVVDVWQKASGLLAVRYEAKTKVETEAGPSAHKG